MLTFNFSDLVIGTKYSSHKIAAAEISTALFWDAFIRVGTDVFLSIRMDCESISFYKDTMKHAGIVRSQLKWCIFYLLEINELMNFIDFFNNEVVPAINADKPIPSFKLP